MEYECNMQDRLDQVSSWCDNNQVVIGPVKTMSMTVTTRQKHFVVACKMSIDSNAASSSNSMGYSAV